MVLSLQPSYSKWENNKIDEKNWKYEMDKGYYVYWNKQFEAMCFYLNFCRVPLWRYQYLNCHLSTSVFLPLSPSHWLPFPVSLSLELFPSISLSPRLSHTFSLCMLIYLCLGICCFISPSLFYLLIKTFALPFHSVPHPTSPGYISAWHVQY